MTESSRSEQLPGDPVFFLRFQPNILYFSDLFCNCCTYRMAFIFIKIQVVLWSIEISTYILEMDLTWQQAKFKNAHC